jgi:hypothetical protein
LVFRTERAVSGCFFKRSGTSYIRRFHEDRSSYDILVNALEERFAPPSFTELYRVQVRECKKKASESLPELGQVLRRLSNLAYPTAPRDVRETLAKEKFIDALHDSRHLDDATLGRTRSFYQS